MTMRHSCCPHLSRPCYMNVPQQAWLSKKNYCLYCRNGTCEMPSPLLWHFSESFHRHPRASRAEAIWTRWLDHYSCTSLAGEVHPCLLWTKDLVFPMCNDFRKYILDLQSVSLANFRAMHLMCSLDSEFLAYCKQWAQLSPETLLAMSCSKIVFQLMNWWTVDDLRDRYCYLSSWNLIYINRFGICNICWA